MKKDKIIFWASTGIIFLGESVVPALTYQSESTIQGITHLGYPLYFVMLLTVFKVLGGLALVIPAVPKRVKEWAYAGFAFDFTCAFISMWVVDGFSVFLILPLVALIILIVSYIYHNKIS